MGYTLRRRLSGFQCRSGHFGEEKHILVMSRIDLWIIQPKPSHYIDHAGPSPNIQNIEKKIKIILTSLFFYPKYSSIQKLACKFMFVS
jgi:hypothetical protein